MRIRIYIKDTCHDKEILCPYLGFDAENGKQFWCPECQDSFGISEANFEGRKSKEEVLMNTIGSPTT